MAGLLVALAATACGNDAGDGPGREAEAGEEVDADQEDVGVWERVDETTLSFTGGIEEGMAAQFEEAFDDRVEVVLLDSGGGITHEALEVAHVLKDAGVETRAVGVCASSCANYLFLAGETPIIDGGLVGYHGNERALVDDLGGVDELLASVGAEEGLSEAEVEAVRAQMEETLQLEEEFVRDLGIRQALFDRTQRPDKGMGDGQSYGLLLPTRETFERYGIAGVQGDHSDELIELLEREFGENAVVRD